MLQRVSFVVVFLLIFAAAGVNLREGGGTGNMLFADTNWTSGSGTFTDLITASNWGNGVPTNTNPGYITGTAETPLAISLSTVKDYNNRIFNVSYGNISIAPESGERKFALAAIGTGTLAMSNGSTLTAQSVWATWGGDSTANFTLNDTSAITLTSFFNVHENQTGSAGVGTANIILNGTSRITSDTLNVRGIMNLSGTGTFTTRAITVQNETIGTADGKQTINVNGGTLSGTTLGNLGAVNLNGGKLIITGYSGSGNLKLAGGTLEANNSSPITIASNIEVAAGTTSHMTLSSKDVVLSGKLTGSGTLTRDGSGVCTLKLSGDNSGFGGTLNANSVNTYFMNASAGSANATWKIGATLASQGLGTTTVNLGGVSGSSTGVLRNDSVGTVTYRVGGKNTDATFSGKIWDSSSGYSDSIKTAIHKVGTGSWTLTGTGKYSGGTTVSGGTLIVNGAAVLGSGDVTVATGGTLNLASDTALGATKVVLAGGTLSQNGVRTFSNAIEAKEGTTSTIDIGSNNMNLNGSLTGSGTINRTGGASTLYLGGDNSGFTGTLNMNAVNTYFSKNSGGSANATWNISATLGSQDLGTTTVDLGEVTGTSTGILRNDSEGTVTYRVGGKNTDATFSGNIRDISSGYSTTKQTAIHKVGTGSWTLTGTGMYSGGTTILGGTLIVNGAAVLGSGDVTVATGGTLNLASDTALGATKVVLAGGTLSQNGVRTFSNAIEAKEGTTSTIDIGSNNMNLNGSLTGSGTINRTGGASTLFLTTNNTDFSGTLNLNAMNTYLLSTNSGSANATWNLNATLSSQGLGTAATVDLGGVSGSSTGVLRNDSTGTTTFRVGGKNTDEVYSGSIRNDFNGTSTTIVTAIEKVGTGSWTLNGDSLIHTGGTTVSSGRLNVNGTLAGNLTLNSSAGTTALATFSPGQDGNAERNLIGTATAQDVSIDDGILLLETDGTNMDMFHVNSLFLTDDSILTISAIDGYQPQMNQTFTFLTSVAALPNVDWNALLDPVSAKIWQITANGNSLFATVQAPEPATWWLLLFGLGLLLRKKR